MRWLLAFIYILLLTTNAVACNDCYEPNAFLNAVTLTDPAHYRIVYTGIEGLILDEYVKLVSRKWADDIDLLYTSGSISESALYSRYLTLSNYRQDYSRSNYADKRTKWWHYMDSWGYSNTYTTGPAGDIINIGPIRVNNKFKFNLNDYDADLTSRWHYKLKPILHVSTKPPFISSIGVGHQFTYRIRRVSLLRITVGLGISFARREGIAEVELDLLNW